MIDRAVNWNRKDLLDYIDFHAYSVYDTSTGEIANNYASWDHILNSINSISGYYYGKSDGDWIKSIISETNVDVSDNTNPDTVWLQRVIENAKQIMALSFNRDKI